MTLEHIIQFYIIATPAMMIWDKFFGNNNEYDGILDNLLTALILVTIMIILGSFLVQIFNLPEPELLW